MKLRRWISTICILLALSSTTVFVSAAAEQEGFDTSGSLNAQKATDWKTKAEAAKSKWKSLPSQQKTEVYALMDRKAADEIKLMEKYCELGIIDETVLARFKEKMTSKMDQIKESGELPMFAEKSARPELPKKKRPL